MNFEEIKKKGFKVNKMSLKDNKIYCINHPNDEMVRNEGLNAITKLIKQDDELSFNPGEGIPIIVYFCNKCGYIELYFAKMTEYWDSNGT